MQTVTLGNGIDIPILGFGTFQISPEETEQAVINALQTGYRHIDTAQAYFNEEEVGRGIANSGMSRDEVFVTTKVWVENIGYDKTKASFDRSLRRLGMDYVDLLLIHQPYSDIHGAWRAMEEFLQEGRVRAIGVSNFTADRCVDLGVFNTVMPQVDQIEINPFHQRKQLVSGLKSEGIVPEAWAPFAEGKNNIFTNPLLSGIANKYGKSVAQVIIRWLVEQGIVVLSKTTKPERMAENLDVFDFSLTEDDVAAIATLDEKESQFITHMSSETVKWMATRITGR